MAKQSFIYDMKELLKNTKEIFNIILYTLATKYKTIISFSPSIWWRLFLKIQIPHTFLIVPVGSRGRIVLSDKVHFITPSNLYVWYVIIFFMAYGVKNILAFNFLFIYYYYFFLWGEGVHLHYEYYDVIKLQVDYNW